MNEKTKAALDLGNEITKAKLAVIDAERELQNELDAWSNEIGSNKLVKKIRSFIEAYHLMMSYARTTADTMLAERLEELERRLPEGTVTVQLEEDPATTSYTKIMEATYERLADMIVDKLFTGSDGHRASLLEQKHKDPKLNFGFGEYGVREIVREILKP